MIEIGLRIFVLFVCGAAVLTSVKVAIWTIQPWSDTVRSYFSEDFKPNQTVMLAPVDMIEGGKIKGLESKSLARRLSHQVAEIHAVLTRNLEGEYRTLSRAGYAVVNTTVEGTQIFAAQTGEQIKFEAELFKFDLAGFLNTIHATLEKRDSVTTMIEIGETRSRIFTEVSAVRGPSDRIVDETGPSIKEALHMAACGIARSYLGQGREFQGFSAHSFCEYVTALNGVQEFIALNAERVVQNKEFDLSSVRPVAEKFESGTLKQSKAPIVHLILASLYRLESKHDKALEHLEAAGQVVPEHKFVSSNLENWQQEKEKRDKAQAVIERAEKTVEALVEPEALEKIYAEIRSQEQLKPIDYLAIANRLPDLQLAKQIKIAVLDTGFTPVGQLPRGSTILAGVVMSDNQSTEDLLGHGNTSIHLMSALLPSTQFSILPIKVMGDSGYGSDATILAGFDYALKESADVICINLGRSSPDGKSNKIYDHAIALAERKGAIVLVAAGNIEHRSRGSTNEISVPANSPGAISVGGAKDAGAWAYFSPGPEGVDLVMPAVDIATTPDGETITRRSGTTFSNVIACALVAIAKSIKPDIGREEVLRIADEASRQETSDGPKIPDASRFIDGVLGNS